MTKPPPTDDKVSSTLNKDPLTSTLNKYRDPNLVDTLTSLPIERSNRLRRTIVIILVAVVAALITIPVLVPREKPQHTPITEDANNHGGAVAAYNRTSKAAGTEPDSEAAPGATEKRAGEWAISPETSVEPQAPPPSSEKDAAAAPTDMPGTPDAPAIREPSEPNSAPQEKALSETERRALDQTAAVAAAMAGVGVAQPQIELIAPIIVSESRNVDLDPLFVSAVIMAESSFTPTTRAKNGKVGLLQISPGNEEYIRKLAGMKNKEKTDLTDPRYNLKIGLWYLKFLEHFYKDNTRDALIGFTWSVKDYAEVQAGKKTLPLLITRYLDNVEKYSKQWSTFKPAGAATANRAESAASAALPTAENAANPAPVPTAAPEKIEINTGAAPAAIKAAVQAQAKPAAQPPKINIDVAAAEQALAVSSAEPPATQSPAAPNIENRLISLMQPTLLPEPEKQRLAAVIAAESSRLNIDPLLAAAIVMSESTFHAEAVSSRGKIGLLQLTPEAAEMMAQKTGLAWHGAEALKDPAYNLKLGLTYLQTLLPKYKGDIDKALLAFNLGEERLSGIMKGREKMPPLAARYVKNVRKYYDEWRAAEKN